MNESEIRHRSHTPNRWVVATVLLVAPLMVAACTSTGGDERAGNSSLKTFKVSVTQATDLYGLPWNVGMKEGIFKKHGIEVTEILAGSGGAATLRQVLSGDLPFGEVSLGAVLDGYAAGAPIKVVGSAVASIADLTYVTNPGRADLDSIEDMAGKTWGFTNPGSGTEVQSYLLPKLAGMDPSSIKRVATGGTGEGLALLEGKTVDLVYIPYNLYYQKPDSYKIVFDPTEYAPRMQITVIITSSTVAEKDPEEVKALLASYSESVEWIQEHSADAAALWASYSGIEESVALKVVQRAIKFDHWSVAFDQEALEVAAEGISLTAGAKTIPWSELFDDSFLPAGKKGSLPSK